MKFLNDMKIGIRLNLVLSLVMIAIISVLSIYNMNNSKKKVISDTDIRMEEQVDDLANIIEMQIEEHLISARNALEVGKALLQSYGNIQMSNGNGVLAEGDGWYLNNENVIQNHDFVDDVSRVTGAGVSIFQYQGNSMKRISSSIKDNNNSRVIGTVVSSNSEVYQTIMNGQEYFGRAVVVDEWNLTAYSPIRNNGQIIGMIGVGIKEKDLSGLRKIFKEKIYFETGYPFLIDNNGEFIIHPTKEGENHANEEFFKQLISSTDVSGKTYYMWEGKQKYQYYKYVEPIDSYVSVSIYESELLVIIRQMRYATLIALIIGIAIFVLVNSQISRSIAGALNKGVEFASKIAAGDLRTKMDINQKDEIGLLADSLNNMVEKLRSIVTSTISGADNVASASQQISSTTQQLSQGASEQASSSEEVSSSMEEMSSNIQQNTDNALETEKIAISAAEGINKVASSAEESLNSTRQIAEKITIINDIAFQTNILALNAAVEAARAGEHGKGFAVVAAEVRKLAERSKIAADEINELSGTSLKVTEEAGELLLSIIPEIQKTASLVQEISSASNEQNSGADQINNAIQQLSQVTQQNAAASEEMATSSEELSSQAEQLRTIISFFKTDDAAHQIQNTNKTRDTRSKLNEYTNTGKADTKSEVINNQQGIEINLGATSKLDGEYEAY